MDRFREERIRTDMLLRKIFSSMKIVLPIIIVVSLIVGWFTFGKLLDLNIKDYMYSIKSGIQYWQKFFLFDGYRTITATIIAFVAIIPFLLIRPRTSYFWSIVNVFTQRRGEQKLYSKLNRVILWRVIEFIIIFVFAWFSLGFGLVYELIILDSATEMLSFAKFFNVFINTITWSFKNIGDPHLPVSFVSNNIQMLMQYHFYQRLLMLFITSAGIRLVFEVVLSVAMNKIEFVAAKVLTIIDLGWLYYFSTIPFNPAYEWTWISLLRTNIISVILLALTVLTAYLGFSRKAEMRSSLRSLWGVLKVSAIVLVVVVASTTGYSFVRYQSVSTANIKDWEFDTVTSKEIGVTRLLAGIEDIEYNTVEVLSQETSDVDIYDLLSRVRLWDEDASRKRLTTEIPSPFVNQADSDILLIDGKQYWVTPLGLKEENYQGDWIREHLLYTHAEGILAIDPTTGNPLSKGEIEEVFGIPWNIPIYYGEDEIYDVYLYTQFDEISANNLGNYQGEPDYLLDGLERAYFFFPNWGFMTGEEPLGLLTLRDTWNRVETILMHGLTTGGMNTRDSYPVFHNNKMYTATHVWIDLNLNIPYAKSNFVYFLGIVLTDVYDGTMDFYLAPTFPDREELDFVRDFYVDYYPWQECPSWLKSQFRYPEPLLDIVEGLDFTYHVTDYEIWKGESDFFGIPSGTGWVSDIYYILTDIGYGPEFVATQMVDFPKSEAKNIAGAYYTRHDQNFGETVFYRIGEVGQSDTIGPTKAIDLIGTSADIATEISLLQPSRRGNVFFYVFGNKKLYIIPLYKEIGGVENVIATVMIDASTKGNPAALSKLSGTDSVLEAYTTLYGERATEERTITGILVAKNEYIEGGNTRYWFTIRLEDESTIDILLKVELITSEEILKVLRTDVNETISFIVNPNNIVEEVP